MTIMSGLGGKMRKRLKLCAHRKGQKLTPVELNEAVEWCSHLPDSTSDNEIAYCLRGIRVEFKTDGHKRENRRMGQPRRQEYETVSLLGGREAFAAISRWPSLRCANEHAKWVRETNRRFKKFGPQHVFHIFMFPVAMGVECAAGGI